MARKIRLITLIIVIAIAAAGGLLPSAVSAESIRTVPEPC